MNKARQAIQKSPNQTENQATGRAKGEATGLNTSLGIGACIYPPQESRCGLPEYGQSSRPSAPVAASGQSVVSRAVLPFDFSGGTDWRALLAAALGGDLNKRGASGSHKDPGPANQDAAALEAIVQAIVDMGQEILPLLGLLRQKAEQDGRLSGLVEKVHSRLHLGIKAACSLSPREMEVLELAATGESNPGIARLLTLQTITVAQTLSRAYRKLGAKNRSDAVRKWMLLRGMLPGD